MLLINITLKMMNICFICLLCIIHAIEGILYHLSQIIMRLLSLIHLNVFFQGYTVILKTADGQREACVSNEPQYVVPIYDLSKF